MAALAFMLILFPFFRELGHPRSNCAVLLSTAGRERHERPRDIRPVEPGESQSEEDFKVYGRFCLPFLLVPVTVTTSIPIVDVVAMLEDVDDFIRLPKRAYRSV